MNNDSDDKSEEKCIYEIAYNNIILEGFQKKILEEKRKKEKEIEEKKKKGKKGEEGNDIKKDRFKEMVDKQITVLSNIFKGNYNITDVIKKTMKENSEKLDKTKVLEYLNNNIFPNIFNMLTSQNFLLENYPHKF